MIDTTPPKDMTIDELRDQVGALRRRLKETEAEIIEREKCVDWPTDKYVWGMVRDGSYEMPDKPGLWVLDVGEENYRCPSATDLCADRDYATFICATPVTLVPTCEWDMLVEAKQAWKDSDFVSVHARNYVTHAATHLISAAKEVQG